MNLKINQEIQKSQQVSLPHLSMLFDLLPRALVQEVLSETQTQEHRRRKLPSEWVVWICIVMSWLPHRSIPSVMGKIGQVMSLGQTHPTRFMASASAISQARYRVGVKPFEQLFKRLCRPMAQPDTSGAFYKGKRLVGFDGTSEYVADTPANASYFGRSSGQYGSSAFPQLRAVYACELGTHIIFDAVVGNYHRGEQTLARRLLRSVTAEMLVLLDAGLATFDLVLGVVTQGGDLLTRSHASRKWVPIKTLADGTFLAWMAPSNNSHASHADPICVRIIRYHLDDETRPHHGEVQTLVTTLLDPQTHPALELIVVYHERWEIELVIDEMDTHQRPANRPLRSLKPLGVLQEFYAFLIAYFLIRVIMLRTAEYVDLDPDRLSFTASLHLIIDALPLFQLMPDYIHPQLRRWLQDWIAYFKIPPRRNRSNPRVVKKQRHQFARKRPRHFNPPQPIKSFRDAIVMLT